MTEEMSTGEMKCRGTVEIMETFHISEDSQTDVAGDTIADTKIIKMDGTLMDARRGE
jgi:hypothetical protein